MFLTFSRVVDFVLPNARLALITASLCLAAALVTGNLRSVLTSRPGIFLTCFTGWLLLATPFSFWKGGSAALFVDIWSKSYLAFVVIGSLIASVRQCCLAMYAIAASEVGVLILSFLYPDTTIDGRFALTSGMLSNPNSLAQTVLLGLPCWLLVALNERRLPLRRLLAAAGAVPLLLLILKCGSRAALLGLLAGGLIVFITARWAHKIAILTVVGAIASVAFSGVLPRELSQRYLTIFSVEEEHEMVEDLSSAVASTRQRLELLELSVRFTLEHPVFGVGPGMFAPAAAAEYERRFEQPNWLVTHNTYTQVSSEMGVPGLVFYLAALTSCLTSTYSFYRLARMRPPFRQIEHASYCLLLSICSFAVTSFFSSQAYEFYFPALAGLATALARCGEAEMNAWVEASEQVLQTRRV